MSSSLTIENNLAGFLFLKKMIIFHLKTLKKLFQASLETFFGLGMIVGPTVGGALYQLGGYTLPFAVMGSCLFTSAIMTAFVLPKHEEGKDKEAGRK